MPSPLAISMGDPAGIGPEICVKALRGRNFDTNCIVVGDLGVMEKTAGDLGVSVPVTAIDTPAHALAGQINVINVPTLGETGVTTGQSNARCGRASYDYILESIRLTRSGLTRAIVTCPISKHALHLAGIPFPGHTEILAHETGVTDYTMMFVLDAVAVVHVTTHCSLRDAIDAINTPRVLSNIRLLHAMLHKMGIAQPRIAVGGLNPHAGENGLFGSEEHEHILPAISTAQAAGIDANGPFPPDTVFMRAFKGEFDGVVAMLHDHGFTALKSRDFERGVNVTVGLPIVRTSVGHGTAFDIAGTAQASALSLQEAIRIAQQLSDGSP